MVSLIFVNWPALINSITVLPFHHEVWELFFSLQIFYVLHQVRSKRNCWFLIPFLDATHISILFLSGLSKDSLNEENSDMSSSESSTHCFFVYGKSWNVGFGWDWWIIQTLLTIQLVFREYKCNLITKNNFCSLIH